MPLLRKPGHKSPSYFSTDTIVAPVSSHFGAISVLRISGPLVRPFTARVAAGTANSLFSNPRKCFVARLVDPQTNAVVDQAMLIFFEGPASFTGEDTLELHCHGGAWITSRVIEVCAAEGIRTALPGEFSFRAVRNGKMELSQAQAVSDLISAQNGGAAEVALEKLEGRQHRQMAEIAEELRVLSMLGEVGIDFSDQDVEEVRLSTLQRRARGIREKLENVKATFTRGRLIQEGFRVVFLGLPNSGKSSFFNALLGEERSIVSEIPGTTRDSVRETLTLRSGHAAVTLRLEDTAGVRKTQDQIESQGIERTWAAAAKADLVILLVDSTGDAKELAEVRGFLETHPQIAGKAMGVLTKTDLLADGFIREDLKQFFTDLGVRSFAEVSSVTGEGVSACAELIVRECSTQVARDPGEVLLTRAEHAQAIEEAVRLLKESETAPGEDLFASDVRHSLHALSPIIGETLTDEILGRIFSSFCIGK